MTCFGRIWNKENEPNTAANSLTQQCVTQVNRRLTQLRKSTVIMSGVPPGDKRSLFWLVLAVLNLSCAPRIVSVAPLEGPPATTITVSMEYLVGWPRVEISDRILDWPQLKLIAARPERRDVPGEELVWIEDKFLQFTIPDISPGEYVVTIHDDKGPPGDLIYSALETTAYVAFPPVWPFVFRSNQTQFNLRVLPKTELQQ